MTAGAARADTAEAATARYEIAVIASYPADACFDTGSVKAVVDFVNRRVARLNGLTDARDRVPTGRKLSLKRSAKILPTETFHF